MNEVPVSNDDGTTTVARPASSRKRVIRLATCCVVSLVVGFATPWSAGASPSSSPVRFGSTAVYAAAPGDNDNDGDPDDSDPDDDNDGTWDIVDEDPLVPRQTLPESPDIIAPGQDSDNDGIENIMDPDDDNDMVEDDEDAAPFVPAPPVDSPAPPAETPEPPAAQQPDLVEEPDPAGPAPARPEQPAVDQPAPARPIRTERIQPESLAVESPPQDTAPLVVALPSTGVHGGEPASFSWVILLAAVSMILATTSILVRRDVLSPARA